MRLQDLSNDLADRQEFVIRAKLQASGNGERADLAHFLLREGA